MNDFENYKTVSERFKAIFGSTEEECNLKTREFLKTIAPHEPIKIIESDPKIKFIFWLGDD